MDKKKGNAIFTLNIIWLILSATLFTLVFFFNWYQEKLETDRVLFQVSNDIRNQLDLFFDKVDDSVYSIPELNDEINTCTQSLKQNLIHTVYNNPLISALVFKNQSGKVLCSTFPQDFNPMKINDAQPHFRGPIQLSKEDKLTYISQQKFGSYSVDVYLLKSVIEQYLETKSPFAEIVALENKQNDSVLMQIQKNKHTGQWEPSAKVSYLNKSNVKKNNRPFIFQTGFNDLENYEILLVANAKKIALLFQNSKIFSYSLALVLSCLLYFYLRKVINARYSLCSSLIHATKHQQFFPVYQPIFDLEDNLFNGVEVLLRWKTDNDDIIMPGSFIDEAEKSGIIVPITLQILERSFLECKSFLHQNPKFHLAINLSAVHFADNDFFKCFNELQNKYQIKPHQLLFEITERDLIDHSDDQAIYKMNRLRQAGFSLAIDDFGTGHASLGYLSQFPFNYLKIDRYYTSAIGTGERTEALNDSIIEMAKRLNLKIIAEGVESKHQLDYLQGNNIHFIQGWYFAKAMTIQDLKKFYQRKANEK